MYENCLLIWVGITSLGGHDMCRLRSLDVSLRSEHFRRSLLQRHHLGVDEMNELTNNNYNNKTLQTKHPNLCEEKKNEKKKILKMWNVFASRIFFVRVTSKSARRRWKFTALRSRIAITKAGKAEILRKVSFHYRNGRESGPGSLRSQSLAKGSRTI